MQKNFWQDAIIIPFVILDNNGKIAKFLMQLWKWVFLLWLTRRHCTSSSKGQNKNRKSYVGRGSWKWTEKFCPWKKPAKDRKQVPRKLPGVPTPRKTDNGLTSDSGPCPSPTEHEYKPRYFNEPDCLSSDKENMPPIESITPTSLKNLSIQEENNEHEATWWEANVVRNLDSPPRSSSPHPKRKTSTLEDLETDTDDNMVDMTDFFDRPQNEKRIPRLKQAEIIPEQCSHTSE